MPPPPATDSKRQDAPSQPTAFVRRVVLIGRTLYVSIPPPAAARLDLRQHDAVVWNLAPNDTLALEKYTNAHRRT